MGGETDSDGFGRTVFDLRVAAWRYYICLSLQVVILLVPFTHGDSRPKRQEGCEYGTYEHDGRKCCLCPRGNHKSRENLNLSCQTNCWQTHFLFVLVCVLMGVCVFMSVCVCVCFGVCFVCMLLGFHVVSHCTTSDPLSKCETCAPGTTYTAEANSLEKCHVCTGCNAKGICHSP